jgi:hypothetical protein
MQEGRVLRTSRCNKPDRCIEIDQILELKRCIDTIDEHAITPKHCSKFEIVAKRKASFTPIAPVLAELQNEETQNSNSLAAAIHHCQVLQSNIFCVVFQSPI